MSIVRWQTVGVILGIVGCAALGRGMGRTGYAASAVSPDTEPQSTPKLKRLYVSASSCAQGSCHGAKEPHKDEPIPLVCRRTEHGFWLEDRHSHAYDALLDGDRAKTMQVLLHIKDLANAPECLSCHSANIPAGEQAEDRTRILREGVTCVACHGPYAEWVEKHHGSVIPEKIRQWRALDRKEKQRLHGMTDLWDPATRAEVCASCHVGNAKEGKFVTHAMYAAGHPPLPSIEFAAFSEEMPRHWEYLREKDDAILETILKDQRPEARRRAMANWERSQLVVIGGAVAFQVSLDLLAAKAKDCIDAKDPDKQVLDYALFDCAACHHELKYPGWRQDRGYRGLKPGRPAMAAWPITLARMGFRHLGKGENELDDALRGLTAGLNERPFGNPARVAKEAAALSQRTKELIDALARSSFDERAAKKLRSLLLDFEGEEYPDYDSARQRAWAYFVVAEELDWKAEFKNRTAKELYRNRLKQFSERLRDVLQLTLPTDKDPTYDEQMIQALNVSNRYDPKGFKRAFMELDKGRAH